MRRLTRISIAARAVVAFGFAAGAVFAAAAKPGDDIDKAMTMFQGIGNRDAALATKYIDAKHFVNHNREAYPGVAGIQGFISHLPPEKSPITVVRGFQDGNYVFTQAEGDLYGPKVFFDIFRFDHGKIVEHWDNLTEQTPPNASGHTPVDGPTQAEDLSDTAKNKAIVTDFYQTIFLNGDFSKMGTFFDGDNFIRHDARGGDGLSALGALMQEQAKQGIVMKSAKSRRSWAKETLFWSLPVALSPISQWLITTCSVSPMERLRSTGTPYKTSRHRMNARTKMASSRPVRLA